MTNPKHLAAMLLSRGADALGARGHGADTLFAGDQAFRYEALRALGYAATGGADINEILVSLGGVKAGDTEAWYGAWSGLAQRTEAASSTCEADPRGRGRMLLKASNYHRTSEFFLRGDDPRKLPAYQASVRAFDAGLRALEVAIERIAVPYQASALDTIYLPGSARARTLVVMVNGYDSTKEETYFALGSEALARGYSFLSYDGPGQGGALRIAGLRMTHDWAPVNRAVLDVVLARHPEIETVVLVGYSLGSVFATKAAADDSRVGYLVHYDVFHDFAKAVGADLPGHFRDGIFRAEGPTPLSRRMLRMAMRFSTSIDWSMRHGAWAMGTGDDYAAAFNSYRHYEIAADAPRVRAPVLLLAGATDHFVPIEMARASRDAFRGSRDVTVIEYSRQSGGGEHCQVGATTLWTSDLFAWLAKRQAAASGPAA